MTDINALSVFLKGALVKEKQDRYLGFISSKKGREKFLRDLDHAIEGYIVASRKVSELKQQQWNENGYLFTSRGIFGEPVENLKAAYESASWDGGWLLVSHSGTIGVFRPEGRIDDEMYIEL